VAALIAYLEHRVDHPDDDTVGPLARLACPYRLIAGDKDDLAPFEDIVKCANTLPSGTLITLHGINHLETMQRSDLVLPHLIALMQRR
jgi:pimeloyl-ACP methyl ester carboxylesterase